MSKDFRKLLFAWKFSEEATNQDPEDCIPFQLQKLFARLSLKKSRIHSTKDLIKSFQWTSQER
jgi:ubiquitin carboxyl-terminal hydrolase 47